ncbi:MAG: glutathione S-transferase [Betaproteobacteria bacterium]|nr:MAG: glutathione S-transferase [Betaproteobacteria bacterium]
MPALVVYGARGSGSIAVEAALTLLGLPYELVEAPTWRQAEARARVQPVNPLAQVPALVFPGGEVMTESAAILIHLADAHPGSGLAPRPGEAGRAQFLRWMVYVSSAIYALHWIKPDVRRIGAPPELRAAVVDAVHDRIASCWKHMDQQLAPAAYLLGERLTVLDLYVAVVSRFGPWRRRFCEAAPAMARVVQRVDAEPRLQSFWARRFPLDEGMDAPSPSLSRASDPKETC